MCKVDGEKKDAYTIYCAVQKSEEYDLYSENNIKIYYSRINSVPKVLIRDSYQSSLRDRNGCLDKFSR